MIWIKYIIITLLFFCFALLQNSFFPYFNILGATPNLVFVLFFILICFEPPAQPEGFFTAIIAGFFYDIFLPSFFGFSIIAFLVIYFLNKSAMHFLKDSQEKYRIFYFIPVFSAGFIINNLMLYGFSIIFRFHFNFSPVLLISLLYSLIFACASFYIYRKFNPGVPDNQLKLFK